MTGPVTIGIFVGGQGTRMGGVAKGLLRTPDGSETLIERLLRQCAHRRLPRPRCSSSAKQRPTPRWRCRSWKTRPPGSDRSAGCAPCYFRARADKSELSLALACDLPFLDETIISTLIAPSSSAARVPFVEGRLQPLAAAYAPAAALSAVDRSLALGQHALMQVLDQLGSTLERVEFDEQRARALRDWDTPEDMRR